MHQVLRVSPCHPLAHPSHPYWLPAPPSLKPSLAPLHPPHMLSCFPSVYMHGYMLGEAECARAPFQYELRSPPTALRRSAHCAVKLAPCAVHPGLPGAPPGPPDPRGGVLRLREHTGTVPLCFGEGENVGNFPAQRRKTVPENGTRFGYPGERQPDLSLAGQKWHSCAETPAIGPPPAHRTLCGKGKEH